MTPEDFLDKLTEDQQTKKSEQDKIAQINAVQGSGDKVVEALKGHTTELTGSIHDLLMATLVSKDPKIAETAKNLAGLLGEIKKATDGIKRANFKPLSDNLSSLQETLNTIPDQIQKAHQATDPTPLLKEIASTLGKKNFNPNVSVKTPSIDLSPLTKILTDIKTAVSSEKEPDNSKLEDLTQSVASGISDVKDAITSLRFPVANYVLPFKDSNGKDAQVTLDSNGNVPTSAGSGTGDVNITEVGGNAVTTTVPVSGTFYQATQPVSGTFWQATQPVSLATNTPVIATGTNSIGKVGTTSAVVNVAQQTVSTTAVRLSVTSTVPTNGIIVQAFSTNAASIFVGDSGVTTSTGFELVAGQAMSFTCNLNTLYIISVASTTDKVCYNVQ